MVTAVMKDAVDACAADDNTSTSCQLPTGARPVLPPAGVRHSRDRPRERLLEGGHVCLQDSELLAVCLGSGHPGYPVSTLATALLAQFGSLTAVIRAPAEQLLRQTGLGPAKVATLKATLGIAERLATEAVGEGPVFSSSAAVTRFLQLKLGGLQREVFTCLMLDSRHRLLRYEELFAGTIDSASVYPREILRRCLDVNAAAIILAHNHPSGVAEPSVADVALTERLRPLLAEVGVRLLDHVVVGLGQVVSMAERGLVR